MLEAKEQAKYYVEKIRSIGKSTNQILLIVFFPLFFLFLNEVEVKYSVASDWINQVIKIDSLKLRKQKFEANTSTIDSNISTLRKTLDTLLKDSSSVSKSLDSLLNNSSSVQKRLQKDLIEGMRSKLEKIAYEIEASKTRLIPSAETSSAKANAKLQQLTKKIHITSDSIKATLSTIQVPVTIPIVNIKLEKFPFRLITFFIMGAYTLLLWYCRAKRQLIIDTLHKFIPIQKRLKATSTSKLYSDYDFGFPFWFFPLAWRRKTSGEQRALINILGIKSRDIIISNILITLVLLGFLLINFRLLQINWNINYKVFHSNYSLLNALCICLFLLDLLLIYDLLKPMKTKIPGSYTKTRATMSESRRKFLATAGALIACALIEPVHGYFMDGKKWYQNSRYFLKRDSHAFKVNQGLYVRYKKRKPAGIYFFNSKGKHPCLKCIRKEDFERFKNNLTRITLKDLSTTSALLKRIKQSDLVAFILADNGNDEERFKLIINYIVRTRQRLSPNVVDLFTRLKVTGNLRGSRLLTEATAKIDASISEIASDPKYYKVSADRMNKWIGRLHAR